MKRKRVLGLPTGIAVRRLGIGLLRKLIGHLYPRNVSVVVHVRLWLSVNGIGKEGASDMQFARPLAGSEEHAAPTAIAKRELLLLSFCEGPTYHCRAIDGKGRCAQAWPSQGPGSRPCKRGLD